LLFQFPELATWLPDLIYGQDAPSLENQPSMPTDFLEDPDADSPGDPATDEKEEEG
jgi:hypothetical protein